MAAGSWIRYIELQQQPTRSVSVKTPSAKKAAQMQEPSGLIYETPASGTQFYGGTQYPYSIFETPDSKWP
jgi:hypothetical protein